MRWWEVTDVSIYRPQLWWFVDPFIDYKSGNWISVDYAKWES